MPARSDLAVAASRLGLALDAVTAGKLERALAAANADHKKYTMTIDDVLRALGDARDAGIGLRHGGKGGPHAMTNSTVVLAVRIDDTVVFAIGATAARAPSPGCVWKVLAPWQQDMQKNLAKARAWASHEPTRMVAKVVDKVAVSLRQSVVTRDAVLGEVLARPHEDEPRLVYADALTARGDPRGEFIVVQCAIAAGSTDPKLVKRETALRRKYGAGWMKDAMQHARACEMRRGFVASMTMTARQFLDVGKLFETEPVEELVILKPTAPTLAKLAEAPHFRRLSRVVFDERVWMGHANNVHDFQTFARSLGHLRSLRLAIGYGQAIDVSGMFDDVAWPNLEVLHLKMVNGQVPESLQRVHMPRIRDLVTK